NQRQEHFSARVVPSRGWPPGGIPERPVRLLMVRLLIRIELLEVARLLQIGVRAADRVYRVNFGCHLPVDIRDYLVLTLLPSERDRFGNLAEEVDYRGTS